MFQSTGSGVETTCLKQHSQFFILSATSYGWTLLILAVRHGHPICVKFLLEEGAPVDYRAKEHTWTPLQFAGSSRFLKGKRVFLETKVFNTKEKQGIIRGRNV